jgi:putative ABC transport system permease protein
MPGPIADDMVAEYPEIEDAFMFYYLPGVVVNYADKNFSENVRMADPGLLRMFDFEFINGDPGTALDEIYSVVISREMAEKYFPGEDPMGKMLRMNNEHHFKVTAVIEDVAANSTFRFDFCIPFHFLEEVGREVSEYGWNSYYTYIQLAEGVSEEEMEAKLLKHMERKYGEESESVVDLWLHPLTDMHLHSVRGGGLIEQVATKCSPDAFET